MKFKYCLCTQKGSKRIAGMSRAASVYNDSLPQLTMDDITGRERMTGGMV